jgi:hypothetical protein
MDYILTLIIVLGIYFYQRNALIDRISYAKIKVSKSFFDVLFVIHFILYIVYTIYSIDNRSDSGEYFSKTSLSKDWFSLYSSGTFFIVFLAYPFVNILNLSYESLMLIFSFIGFEGLVFFYLAARENIYNLPLKIWGFSVLELFFLFPNCHFWSSSLGKGSVMTFGLGLLFFGLSRFQERLFPIILGAYLVYMIRVHILLAILIGVGIGSLFSFGKLKWYFKILIIGASIGGIAFVMDDVLALSGTETINILDDNANVNRRASELGKSNTGIDISNYNQAMKLFTFIFRPLFFDAPNFMGIITSVEDVVYLFLAIQIILIGFPQIFKWNGFFIIGFFSFLIASLALAQVSGNLGIALRQKAQIMPLFFMVYCKVASLKYNKL